MLSSAGSPSICPAIEIKIRLKHCDQFISAVHAERAPQYPIQFLIFIRISILSALLVRSTKLR